MRKFGDPDVINPQSASIIIKTDEFVLKKKRRRRFFYASFFFFVKARAPGRIKAASAARSAPIAKHDVLSSNIR